MPDDSRQVGPYTIDRELGRGGMGEVFLAHDPRLGRQVAIKRLPAHLARDPDRLARFQREAKVLGSLNHPGIAAIYGLEEAAGQQHLILEYVEGQTLAAQLKDGPLPVNEALAVARLIAEALEAAHEKAVIHRDLKPANVMVTPDGAVKVLDFGLARIAESSLSAPSPATPDSPTLVVPGPTQSPTIPGAIMGTAGYMSPEQARGKPVDKRSDIFSFGCVVYEMLTGVGPFQGETVTDALGAVLHQAPDWKRLPATTPARVRELLVNCLTKDRKQRLRDIGDARLELERAIAGHDLTPVGEATRSRTIRMLISFGLAVVLVGLGAGLWSVFGGRTGSRAGGGPMCLTITIPTASSLTSSPGLSAQQAFISRDGQTLVVRDQPRNADGTGAAKSRIFTRRLGSYEFNPLAGTEGAIWGLPGRDSGSLILLMPIMQGAPQKRLARMPLDGSAPATSIADWKDNWRSSVELANGDNLVMEGDKKFVRLPKGGGAPSAPIELDAGRPGISRFEFVGEILPGEGGVFVNVVFYDARGYHYSAGVMNAHDGKVKLVVDDGGNGTYSPTGHLLFARGGVILAAPFDAERVQLRGAPVAVWSGLATAFQSSPGAFQLTGTGALFYRPGQAGGERSLAVLGPDGKAEAWSPDRWAVDSYLEVSPDGRRLVCSLVNGRGIDEIWVSPLDHADFVRIGSDPSADCFGAAWSPEGGRLAYYRRGKDSRDGIYLQNTDGSAARRVLKTESDGGLFCRYIAWLPDGSSLLLSLVTSDKNTLMVLPLGDSEADPVRLRPLLPGDFNRYQAIPSADGKLVAFASDETGKVQTWVAELRAGREVAKPIQVRTSGWIAHAWTADGKALFIQDEHNRLMMVTVTNGTPPSVSAPVEVLDLEKHRIQRWSVLPGGRFLVALKNDNEGEISHYNLVLNWIEGLKQKLPVGR